MSKDNPTKHDLVKANRKMLGLCVSCGHTMAEEGHVLCRLCIDGRIARAATNLAKHMANSACTICGGPRDRPHKRTCSVCAARNDASRKKKLAQRLKEAPIMCSKCGIRPRLPEFTHCDICIARGKKFRVNLKEDLINGYGGKCTCCGETEPQFLTIDHIEGGGGSHRKLLGSSQQVYAFLRANNYPSGYQLHCYNCNSAKGAFGICPHERDRRKALTCEKLAVIEVVPMLPRGKPGRPRHINSREEAPPLTVPTTPHEFTSQQAAHYLGIARKSVYKLINQGALRNCAFGNHRRILFSDLRAYKERIDQERALNERSLLL